MMGGTKWNGATWIIAACERTIHPERYQLRVGIALLEEDCFIDIDGCSSNYEHIW
jgi:hypothetical protein